ncbi:MAG: hypothetical protein JNM94_13670 [Phycisphaerae bacterium]|nr:hypothetical protein [Phycisphaerae bacterium]
MRASPPIAALVVSALAATALLAGCASPRVGVQGARVSDSNPESTLVEVDIELTNPADDTMRLFQWDYRFTCGGATYSGLWEALLALPPENTPMRTSLPCVVPTAALDQSAPWTISGTLTYRSPSRLALIPYDLQLYQPTTSFSGSGTGMTVTPVPIAPPPPPPAAGAVR